MPKKTRKMKQRAAMRRTYQAAEQEQNVEAMEAVPQETTVRMRPSAPASTRATTPLSFDYSYIYSDLKRIAAFAVFFFAVLIALSFVIK
jgi:hypothetical protein